MSYTFLFHVRRTCSRALLQSAPVEEDTFLKTFPGSISPADDPESPKVQGGLGKLLKGPDGPEIQKCTRKCATTCIRGGDGAPGLGPLTQRREPDGVVFKVTAAAGQPPRRSGRVLDGQSALHVQVGGPEECSPALCLAGSRLRRALGSDCAAWRLGRGRASSPARRRFRCSCYVPHQGWIAALQDGFRSRSYCVSECAQLCALKSQAKTK